MATFDDLMKSWSIVVPLDVKRRGCRVVSRAIPAASLSLWQVLHPRSRCFTLWILSEHWQWVEL